MSHGTYQGVMSYTQGVMSYTDMHERVHSRSSVVYLSLSLSLSLALSLSLSLSLSRFPSLALPLSLLPHLTVPQGVYFCLSLFLSVSSPRSHLPKHTANTTSLIEHIYTHTHQECLNIGCVCVCASIAPAPHYARIWHISHSFGT